MLGNWSFGDYYKKESIRWAWDLLTRVYGLPKERLWASVLEDDEGNLGRDEEAIQYWLSETEIDPDHIVPFGRKDNFWEMGDTGPCGPCSEIHFDRGPEACDKQDVPGHVCKVNGDCQRITEFWNLVFIQYNRDADGILTPLPAKHIDTGMGFERVVAILQDKPTNYRTDLFWPIIQKTQQMAGQSDEEREAQIIAYRVIADHVRAVTFLVGDGVLPANDGRGYVPRMILRRAVRFGRKLGFAEPFMAELADMVIARMGHVFPELPARRDFIKATITGEEQRFLSTLDRGLDQLEDIITEVKEQDKAVIPGEAAFFLHDTLGLPLEVTRDIAEEAGLSVDTAGYHEARRQQQLRSSAGGTFQQEADEHARLYPALWDAVTARQQEPPQHAPYGALDIPARVVGLLCGETMVQTATEGDRVEIVLDTTNFYVESGGQVSDIGRIEGSNWVIEVEDTRRPIEDMVVHIGHVVKGTPHVGDDVRARVNATRRWDIMRNHTATHLLHHALRDVLGSHVAQAGSMVAPDRLRFDYNHDHPLTPNQRAEIERKVIDAVMANYPVTSYQANYADALSEGVIALFEEKYGDVVRVLRIGEADAPFSRELCGGTHVQRTGDIGPFLLLSEGSIGAGKRRIEATTGRGALAAIQATRARQEQAAALLDTIPQELPERVERLQAEFQAAHREIENLTRKLARADFKSLLDDVIYVDDIPVLAAEVDAPDADTLREMADWFRDKMQGGVIVLGTVVNGKPLLIAATTRDLVQTRNIHAGQLIKQVAKIVGGGGGGRPDMAQAGGKDAKKLNEALASVRDLVQTMLNA
jgi:alanyl-tRNA synthetase